MGGQGRAGDQPPAAPRRHHPPAGGAEEPRPVADRRRHLRRVALPRPDLARRSQGPDADHADDGRLHRPQVRRHRVRAGRPGHAADQHRLRLVVPALPARPLPRQHDPRARGLQRRRGQGRRVVARGGRPRRALPRRRPHPVPRDARTTWARCSTPAARTGASTRASWACEPAPARPHRPRGLGDRLRRLGHRQDDVARRRRRRVAARARPRDRSRAEPDRHRARLRQRPQRAARRPGRARAPRGDRGGDQDPAQEHDLAGARRHRPRRGVPGRPRPRLHRAQPEQPRARHDRRPAVPRLVRRLGRAREAGSRRSRSSRPRGRSARSASRSTTTSPRTR